MSQTEQSTEENVSPTATEDKKSIQEEEREKILNVENEQKNSIELAEEKKPKEVKEGMEVKPKKIPIGGIQMPGFFTRSKSKEQCKDEDQAEGTELIEQEKKEETPVPTRIKLPTLPNPFKKNKAGDVEEGGKEGETKDKLKLLESIRLPIVSVFQRIKRNPDASNQSQAGLASMETLDDKSNNELKTIPLDDKTETDKQEQADILEYLTQMMKKYKIAIVGCLIFLLLIIIIIICTTGGGREIPRSPPLKDGNYIETVTSCGIVEGKMEDSSFAFRGIPYAIPPIGNLRFKYAQPLNQIEYCWNATLKAHNATPTCLQVLGNGSITGVEDCLTLDIVTPYVRYDNPLPVVVLIGADSFIGGSPGKMRPSARYARSKDVVFVRPNFRLGALGFLSLDVLSKSDYPHTSGNYGLSDILEALWWIQLNIEHFGGDKKSVTLFGHKAGATLVTALATIPNAKKYFTRAWASSGGAVYPSKPRNESEAEARSFLQHVDCEDAECLRRTDAKKLIKSVQHTWRKPQPDLPGKDEDPSKRHQWLVIDGKILKENPSDVWSRGRLSVDLVIGSTAQAGSSEILRFKHTNWTSGLVRHHIKESFLGSQNLTDEVLKRYPATYHGLSTLVTDIRITCPLYTIWTEMSNVTFYVDNRTRWENKIADVDSDIEAILGRYEPKTPEQKRYFSSMQGLFYSFVWHGKIDQKFTGKNVLIVDQDVLPNATYSECGFWALKNVVPRFAALD
ncbi:neurotactin [Euwallacea similis]|uniref:neurotactin n=1 Tax=Euwallacea similis TaxID=1736056 RepID=UPI00344CE460